jgi:hypothetical protein
MISEKQIENQIKAIKDIKPRQDWAISLKSRIMEGSVQPQFEPSFGSMMLNLAPRYATVAMVLFVLGSGIFVLFSNNVTPQVAKNSDYYLDVAAKKAQEVEVAAKSGDQKKLTAAINDSAAYLQKAAEVLPSKVKSKQEGEALAQKVQNIATALEAARKESGTQFATTEQEVLAAKATECIQNTITDAQRQLEQIVKNEIANLASSTLSTEQDKKFNEAKLDFAKYQEEGDWQYLQSAAEKIYFLSGQQ